MKFTLAAVMTFASSALAQGGLTQVTDFGSNPSGALMYTYAPSNLQSNPAILVVLHHCQGTAQSMFQSTPYAGYADQSGSFLIIYAQSPYQGTCWDVSSDASLTRDGGGNSQSIATMTKWAIEKYGADASKVFLMGESSGAMMTNVMAATYPDLYAAGVVYSGVPHHCFYTNSVNGWNSDCAGGRVDHTPAEWAQMVFDSYQDYNGTRPRMRIYHGDADTTLNPNNYHETIDQWSGVFGYDPSNPESETANDPAQGMTTRVYGDHLEGVLAAGAGHGVPKQGEADMAFWGL
ncbi:esterase PHB depolymerase domain-containing protein [Sarocladium implicatum]|nr:esterase PHB depolymerase domain-containing protein [Sarocladium implicatum]